MRRKLSWLPIAWYLGIAVVEPLLNGAAFGEHLATTLLVAGGFFVTLVLSRQLLARRRIA